ncbi:MAG: hypothetical protein ACOYYJ_20485 [Chloroflexota bacterium]
MRNSYLRITNLLLCILIVVVSTGCSTRLSSFQDGRGKFQINNNCIDLSHEIASSSMQFQGTVWYDDDNILHSGTFGLHWTGNNSEDIGVLPIDPIQMFISPDGEKAIFDGLEVNVDKFDPKLFSLKNREYQKAKIDRLYRSPVWTINDLWLGTDWDFEKGTITVITTDLTTGAIQENTIRDRSMSSEPAPKIASNGVLTYIWYQNYEGPRLVVYDTKTNTEIVRYKDINYQIRPFWHGYLLNPQGTHILSISSLVGEGYNGKQQELFGVEIGKEPVQITDFHSKYPYVLIYDINFGGQRWSPDNRWIVIHVLTSETQEIDSTVDPSSLFLVDLYNNVAQRFCDQATGTNQHITWSPDSKYFALSMNDKIWIIDPLTLESRLLVEKPGISLTVMGWTIP